MNISSIEVIKMDDGLRRVVVCLLDGTEKFTTMVKDEYKKIKPVVKEYKKACAAFKEFKDRIKPILPYLQWALTIIPFLSPCPCPVVA